MTTVGSAPGLPPGFRMHSDADVVNTIPDLRSPSTSPNTSGNDSLTPSHHPDLSSEVAALSNKLIDAINYQTNLDDTLAATRHELDFSKERVRQLEAAAEERVAFNAKGIWIKKEDAQWETERETSKLRARLAEEKRQRTVAEQGKKDMEQELESLTAVLFEEANEVRYSPLTFMMVPNSPQMVAAARKERDSMDRKNEQLRSQLNDTELLLASHQEQLAELKIVMQQMHSDREEIEASTNQSTGPSTPALGTQENLHKIFEALHLSPNTPGTDDISPSHPTSFSHLLHPVLRTDLQAYEDFSSLLRMSRNIQPGSRASSGSYGGLNVMGLSSLTNSTPPQTLGHVPSNGSASSISTAGTYNSSPGTPNTPASSNGSFSSKDAPHSLTPLKETRFYKRALTEDIEPTLRLDTAPGLSWLARRTVLTSMSEGSLIVEPMPAAARLYVFSCALCGENRKGEEHTRSHRFRTSEAENAQRYPLCNYCLGRVRASCDFLGFLRVLRDGHWRTEGENAEKAAWEESVRLRERMFWARIGGGVLPAFIQTKDSPRTSTAEEGNGADRKLALGSLGKMSQDDEVSRLKSGNEDPFRSDKKRMSIGTTVIFTEKDTRPGESAVQTEEPGSLNETPPSNDAEKGNDEEGETVAGLRENARSSLRSNALDPLSPEAGISSPKNTKRLSISIPGAFE
ncbi:MAG: rab guanine nucleotide exchange factor S2 [Pycnora praestabilis]|nr:MAG: rab guanine nucleotide exchange factor S2 [Pycnora praestabilis]